MFRFSPVPSIKQCIVELRNYVKSENGASEASSSSLLASLAKMQIFLFHTLNFWTSSGLAIFPSETQVWKNEGATEIPKASAVIPVFPRSELMWIS